MVALYFLGLFMLLYLYGGYALVLRVVTGFKAGAPIEKAYEDVFFPTVTVLVTVYNEDDKIKARINNILKCEYPKDKLQILVASDGSTDATDEVVREMRDERVKLFRPKERKGKTDTQNQAIKEVSGEILVFTDADTQFERTFLKEIVRPFSDPSVGGVDGHLKFITDEKSGVSQSQGFYWAQELLIRKFESYLGVLAVASGACMSIRTALFRPMVATVGEDCLVPLDVVSQGYRMVHADKALAFDRMEHDSSSEFKTRVRMTLRNWQGTWLYPHLLNPFKNPGVAFSLWSHKVLRWLSPMFLILWVVAGLGLYWSSSPFNLLGISSLMFIVLALLGMIANYLNQRIPIASGVYSFCLANAGFLVGVVKALIGEKVTSYR